jgi:hypothetical protein
MTDHIPDVTKMVLSPAAQDIQELMNAWNTIVANVRAQFPKATEENIYQFSRNAFYYSLNWKPND